MHFEGPFVIATKIDRNNPEIQLISPREGQSGLETFLSAYLTDGLWLARFVGSWGFYDLGTRAVTTSG